jgi:hypothetical protein
MSSLTVPIPPDLSPACRARNTVRPTGPRTVRRCRPRVKDTSALAGALAGGEMGAEWGAGIGTFIEPGGGTVVGGIIGGVVGGIVGGVVGSGIGDSLNAIGDTISSWF